MPKRQAESARIIAYFQSAPLDAAQAIFGVVGQIMRERSPKAARAQAKAPRTRKDPTPERPGEGGPS